MYTEIVRQKNEVLNHYTTIDASEQIITPNNSGHDM